MPESLIRTVVTEEDARRDNGLPNSPDDYKTTLLKYIPAETVTVYTSLIGVVWPYRYGYPAWYYWLGVAIVFLIGLVGTYFILTRAYGMKRKYKQRQIFITMGAYVLWVASIEVMKVGGNASQEATGTASFIMTIQEGTASPEAILVLSLIIPLLLGGFTTLVPFVNPGTNTSDEERDGQAREKDTEEQNRSEVRNISGRISNPTVGLETTRHLDEKEEHGMLAEDFTQANEVQELRQELKRVCEGKLFSDVIDDQGNQYVDLVMEGGGVLGVALVGYTYMLEEMGIRFLRVGGTSAGSINAVLVAGLGTPEERKSQKLVKELAEVDFWTFVDGDEDVRDFVQTLVRRPGLFSLSIKGAQIFDSIFKDLGLNPGDAFYGWLSEVLSREGVGTTQKLRERMAQLPPSLRTREGEELGPERANPYLALVAADVSTQTKVEFPKMASLYWADPDEVDPALYVRASMSIPYFFYPLRVKDVPQGDRARARWEKLVRYNEEPPEICTLVDGGIMSNFPIDLFHIPEKVPAAPTFGAKLGTDRRRSAEISSPQRLGAAVFRSASHTLDYDFITRNPDYQRLVAYIDTGPHGWLDFDMDKEDKLDLFVRGARKAAEFLTTFDWEGYKKIRRRKKELYT